MTERARMFEGIRLKAPLAREIIREEGEEEIVPLVTRNRRFLDYAAQGARRGGRLLKPGARPACACPSDRLRSAASRGAVPS